MSRQASKPSKLRKDSLAWRVIDFLEANPTEELTRHDVSAKFDIDPVAVEDALMAAVTSGHLVRELNTDSVLVFRLKYSRSGVPKPFSQNLATARRATRKPPVVIDFDSLVIEAGVPLVENTPGKGGVWTALFARMKPGDSVKFTLDARDALSHAQYGYRKDNPRVRFTIRKVDAGHCRIWRLEDAPLDAQAIAA
jgi:hypothetical protein